MSSLITEELVEQIRAAEDPQKSGQWPTSRLARLRDGGVFQWGLPAEFGGREISVADHLGGYMDLSRVCLTTSFIMTQRDAACHRIAASANPELRQRLLPDLAAGRIFATVGISHLSTSRQHWSKPSVLATSTPDGFELTGEAPWVTGGNHTDILVTGGTLSNGDQLLVAIPNDRAGVRIALPLDLVALNAASTGTVFLDRVAVTAAEVVAGPIPQVMKVGVTGGTGSLTTSAVAIGAASHTIDKLRAEASGRPDLQNSVDALCSEYDHLRAELLRAAQNPALNENRQAQSEHFRYLANSLSMRAALAYVCYAKGAGYLTGHPAEMALRESLFFQVWSCPPAVTARTISQLISPPNH